MLRPVRTRRLIALAASCALLGAVTSIALAIGLAWVRTPISSYTPKTVAVTRLAQPLVIRGREFATFAWLFQDQHQFGERTLIWMSVASSADHTGPLPGRPVISASIDRFFDLGNLPLSNKPTPPYGGSTSIARLYGWPLVCLWQGESVNGMNAGLTRWPWNGPSYGGIKIANSPAMGHFLPTLPLWPGLIADTAFYGAAWLGLFLLLGPARRAQRRRRGLCVRCRYDLRGLAPGSPCPECGTLSR